MPEQSSAPVTFWSLLDDADRAAVRAIGTPRDLGGDRILFAQDEDSDYLLIVVRGCVKVVTDTATGYRAVLGLRGPGDLLGEQAGLEGRPRSAALSTVTPTRVLLLGLHRFRALSAARPGVGRAVDQVLSRRLRESDQLRVSTADPVPVRLAALLLELAERYGEPGHGAGEVRITLPLSQDDLAGLVVSSRRTVSRVLEQWRAFGWVTTGRQSLLLTAVDRLKEQAYGG
jgi:CRP/FNR family cyclic AMP-dependent transcriptional regulator